MIFARYLSRLGAIWLGSAKALTMGQPDGDQVEPLGEKYDIG